jgi:hypothetical protein
MFDRPARLRTVARRRAANSSLELSLLLLPYREEVVLDRDVTVRVRDDV